LTSIDLQQVSWPSPLTHTLNPIVNRFIRPATTVHPTSPHELTERKDSRPFVWIKGKESTSVRLSHGDHKVSVSNIIRVDLSTSVIAQVQPVFASRSDYLFGCPAPVSEKAG
jgi:hypothetical protein